MADFMLLHHPSTILHYMWFHARFQLFQKHFDKSQYEQHFADGRKLLRSDTEPTILIHAPAHLKPKRHNPHVKRGEDGPKRVRHREHSSFLSGDEPNNMVETEGSCGLSSNRKSWKIQQNFCVFFSQFKIHNRTELTFIWRKCECFLF